MMNKSLRLLFILAVFSLVMNGLCINADAEDLTVRAYRQDYPADSRPGHWTLRLQFNKAVYGSNLIQTLSATSGSAQIELDLLTTQNKAVDKDALSDFLVIPKKPLAATTPVVIRINKGLSDSSGRSRLVKDFSYTFLPGSQVSITEVDPYYVSKTDAGVIITLSDSVNARDIEKAIKISPRVSGLNFLDDENRKIRITGKFKPGQNYTLECMPVSLKSGRLIMEAGKFPFVGSGVTTQISSQTTASVVELKSRQLFPLSLTGVTTIRAELTGIPAILVPDVFTFNASGQALDDNNWKWLKETLQILDSNGIAKKQFLAPMTASSDAFFSPESKDKSLPYSLPLTFRNKPDRGGAWLLELTDADSTSTNRFVQLLQITDISISYKLSEKSLLIWVTSINEGLPLADVEVLVRGKGQTTYYIGKTDKDGLIRITDAQEALNVSDDSASRLGKMMSISLQDLSWIIAATDTDSSAIKLDNFRIKPFVWNQQSGGGQDPSKETGYIFTERGIYRPGETVHFKFVSRSYKDDQIVSAEGEKVRIDITSPRGDVLYSRELRLNSYGSCFDDFSSQSYMPLGTYSISASFLKGSDSRAGFSQTFLLEQFKEPRHLVSLSVRTEDKKSNEYIGLDIKEETLLVDVNSRYYAGGQVRNGRVRWKVDLVPATNKVKDYEGFFFGNSNSETRFLESGESNLDGHGNLLIRVPLDSKLLTGVYGIKISVTALDVDGEPATEVTTFNPRPKYLIGLSEHPEKVQSGYSGAQKFVVLGPDGKPVSEAPVEITWLQKKYLYLQKRDEQGNMVESWEEGWIRTFSSSQTARDGQGSFNVELVQPGDYMVNVSYEKDQVKYASQTTYSVDWDDYERWMRSQGPGNSKSFGDMVVTLNRKEFQNNQVLEASSSATKPVKKVLATIERDKVIEAKVFDAGPRNIKFGFPVSERFRPNVFVGAMAPSARQKFPLYYNQADADIPTIFSGYANAFVKSDVKKLTIEIEPGVKELRGKPGSSMSLKILAKDHNGAGVKCELAVCVVNEGVLALTGFKTPDLSSLADFSLPLSVVTGDLRVGLVTQDLLKILRARPVTGGGDGSGYVSPSLRKDFRPVAFYNPSVITSDSGEAKIDFTLPDTTTAYRVYVVAADNTNGFASAQKNLVASKEFYVEPSTPRFLCFADKASFPVVINNTTDKEGSVRIDAKASEGFKVRLKDSSVNVAANSNVSTMLMADVETSLEEAVLTLAGEMKTPEGKFDDAIETKVPISSRHSPVRVSMTGAFTSKTEFKVNIPEYVAGMNSAELTNKVFNASLDLSITDWARITPTLNYLMSYPFGCIEQTSSAVFPLVGLKSLVSQGVIPNLKTGDLDRFVNSGIERILSMQLSNGAFSYWPRQSYESFWGTVYATYALEKARQAGYKIPQESLKKALKYIKDNFFKSEKSAEDNEQDWIKGWAVLTLAEGNALSHQDFEPFFKTFSMADEETRALLLLAAKKINYLPSNRLNSDIKALKIGDKSIHSGYMGAIWRKQAALLMAKIAIEGHTPDTDALAASLIKGLKPEGRWGSTADSGWCLLALSKYYKAKPAAPDVDTEVTISYGANESVKVKLGKVGVHVPLPATAIIRNKSITLSSNSKALVNYNFNAVYPDQNDKTGHKSQGMEIAKHIQNLNGKSEIRVGDIVKITLTLNLSDKKPGSSTQVFQYVALEDFVPAGLYPINTKIATEGADLYDDEYRGEDEFDYGNTFVPTFMEYRDEGVRIFKNKIYDGSYEFSYLARAVTQGEFWMRGSRLSLMYDPSRYASIPGKKIVIAPTE